MSIDQEYLAAIDRFAAGVAANPTIKPNLYEGEIFWIPCAGTSTTPKGHVGELRIAVVRGGAVVVERTQTYLNEELARRVFLNVNIESTSGHCPDCFKITEEV